MRPTTRFAAAVAASASLLILATPSFGATPHRSREGGGDHQRGQAGAVYAISNEASGNQLLFYRRGVDGALTQEGSVATGGTGTGLPRLSSQNSRGQPNVRGCAPARCEHDDRAGAQ